MEKTGYPDHPTEPPPSYYPQQSMASPQPGFIQQGQQPMPGYAPSAPTVITVVQAPNLSSESTRMMCPFCQADISTKVTYQTSCMTHVAAAILCLFGLWCCACIPYCTDSCMDAEHECPNCHKFLGQYRRWLLIRPSVEYWILPGFFIPVLLILIGLSVSHSHHVFVVPFQFFSRWFLVQVSALTVYVMELLLLFIINYIQFLHCITLTWKCFWNIVVLVKLSERFGNFMKLQLPKQLMCSRGEIVWNSAIYLTVLPALWSVIQRSTSIEINGLFFATIEIMSQLGLTSEIRWCLALCRW